MIETSINGKRYRFDDGISILDACRSVGIAIPTLCHDERLKAIGSCRMCLVEIEGKPRPVTACNTLVTDGMKISTHTPALENERRMVLRMLAQDHPGDCLQQPAQKPFCQEALRYGLSESDFNGTRATHLVDNSHPYIRVDMSKCITCYRCVRICEELQGQFVWQVINRGHETRIVPDSGTTLGESSCVSCGACVDTCPSGALEDKSTLEHQNPTKWTRTTCPYCGTGCEMNVGTDQNRIVKIKPVLDAPVNRGHLCVKGRYAFDFVDAADRITVPMLRTNDGWRPLSWDEAISLTATRFQQIAKEHGPNSMVQSRYGSASLPIRITQRVQPRELFATFHDAAVFLNRVTSPHRDRYVKSPEYKVTAVKIVRLDDRVSNSIFQHQQRSLATPGSNV